MFSVCMLARMIPNRRPSTKWKPMLRSRGISQTLQYSVSITRSISATQGVLRLKKMRTVLRHPVRKEGTRALNRCCEQRHMHGKVGGTCELPLKKATKSVAFSCEMCYTILRSIRLSG